MSKKKTYNIKKNMSIDELNNTIHALEKQAKLLQRLYFIRFLYKGMKVEDASKRVGITKVTGYRWLKIWNEKGQMHLMPNFKGGRKPKLDQFKRDEVKEMIKNLELKKSREVQKFIQNEYGIDYSLWQVRRILNSFKKE